MAEPETDLPIPPRELLARIGDRHDDRDDEWFNEMYERSGLARRMAIQRALPPDFSFDGARVLDFGCGAGRVLRQFAREAKSGEYWGCDLYEPTISWLKENLEPPFRFYVSAGRPLPHPDEYFDLVYAISVFTHITNDWAEWMLELRRILKPGGFLLATFIGPRLWERSLKREVAEDDLGMAMLRLDQSYETTSGPLVLHSPWWIQAHWGRAFETVNLWPEGFTWPRHPGETQEEVSRRLWAAKPGHGVFVGQKRVGAFTAADLEDPEPGDAREEQARRFQDQLQRAEQQAAMHSPRSQAGPRGWLGRLRAGLSRRLGSGR
jgi:ubiquinone/menaquinone biosynthesis C-methylase UbiE